MVLRTCGSDADKSRALLAHFNALENLQTRTHRQGAGATMLIASVVELGLQVVVLSGIVWVVTGTLNLAFLIAAVAMIMRFAEPMAMFISYTSVVELIASALQRIEQFMAIAPLPVAEQSEMPERYDIRFDNVSYRYEEGDGHALNHVSLTFPAASMSALRCLRRRQNYGHQTVNALCRSAARADFYWRRRYSPPDAGTAQ